MIQSKYDSQGITFPISLFPCPSDGKKYPAVLLVHGNAGLIPPFGNQIRGFAEDLSVLGYFAAVPKYYRDDNPHLTDRTPHVQTISDAIEDVSGRPGVDRTRIGLIGFSLGAATCMTLISSRPKGTISVLADFFGFLTPEIKQKVGHFPPTIILHNKNDNRIVPVQNSYDLDKLLSDEGIEHLLVPPYDEIWELGGNHSFKPGGLADVDSRAKATAWIVKHLKPVGI